MLDNRWYLLVVAIPMLLVALWSTLQNTSSEPPKKRLHYFWGTFVNCAISSTAYWVLVFVLTLVIAAAIWLMLLLIIWVPSEFFQNYFGSDVFSRALENIKPAIYKSPGSPGFTHIPLLDYLSLSAAYVLGPIWGVWSILNQNREGPRSSDAQPQN